MEKTEARAKMGTFHEKRRLLPRRRREKQTVRRIECIGAEVAARAGLHRGSKHRSVARNSPQRGADGTVGVGVGCGVGCGVGVGVGCGVDNARFPVDCEGALGTIRTLFVRIQLRHPLRHPLHILGTKCTAARNGEHAGKKATGN